MVRVGRDDRGRLGLRTRIGFERRAELGNCHWFFQSRRKGSAIIRWPGNDSAGEVSFL